MGETKPKSPEAFLIRLLKDVYPRKLRLMTLCWLVSDVFDITDFKVRRVLAGMMIDKIITCKHGSIWLKEIKQ